MLKPPSFDQTAHLIYTQTEIEIVTVIEIDSDTATDTATDTEIDTETDTMTDKETDAEIETEKRQ